MILLEAFIVDFVPSWKTLINITFAYSCITATKSDNLSNILLTTSPFWLSNAESTDGSASLAALGLCFNHLTIKRSASDLTKLCGDDIPLYKCWETSSSHCGRLLVMWSSSCKADRLFDDSRAAFSWFQCCGYDSGTGGVTVPMSNSPGATWSASGRETLDSRGLTPGWENWISLQKKLKIQFYFDIRICPINWIIFVVKCVDEKLWSQ